MYILFFAGFAFLGGIVSAVLGYLAAGLIEPFIWRKFLTSVLKAFVAAVAAAGTGALVPPVGNIALILFCIAAFIAGVGVDAGTKRVFNATAASWREKIAKET